MATELRSIFGEELEVIGQRLGFLAGCVLAIFGVAHGQQLTGRIEGLVVDPQGAIVPSAAVTATHEGTNFDYRADSTSVGRFVIPNARLGNYRVAAEASGFRRSVITDVLVEVGTTATLTIQLELGPVTEEITVSSETAQAIVNTVDAEIGTTVDNRRVLELPLNGRNAVELAMQQAGVYFERNPDGQGDKLFIHGQRHRAINMTLDGIDTQDNYNRSSATMIDQPLLPMAAENVQEFKVITGLSSAEYSRGASQISAVTRSGTNQFHGSVFWFNRNDAFSANDFFNNSATPAVDTPPLNRNQFGGRIGGPVIRDRTFFYLGYQQTREARGIPVNREVYTAQARGGLFRYLDGLATTPANVAASPGAVRSVNLLGCGPEIMASLGRDCLDGRFNGSNPASLDPFIRDDVFGLIPLPNNFDVGDGLNTGGFRFNAKTLTFEHLPSARLDHRIRDAHSFYGTVNYVDRDIQGDFINGRERPYPDQEPLGSRVTHSRGFSAGLVSTLSPLLVNEFRFGYLGGENAFLVNQPFNTPFTLQMNNIYYPYDPANNDEVRDNRTVHLRNVASWIKDRHQLKFGVEWREKYVDSYAFDEINPYGHIGLDDNDNPPGFNDGNLLALSGGQRINSDDSERARDMSNDLTGSIAFVLQRYNVRDLQSGFVPLYPERRTYKNHELDWFVNDTWSLRPNLTLTLGLRWEYASVPYELNGLVLAPEGNLSAAYGISGPSGFFNPGKLAGTPCGEISALPSARTTSNVAALITGCATKYYPATSTNGRPLFDDDWNNFAPVVNLAWDPTGDGKTAIRSGFRISYMQDHFAIIDSNIDDNEGLVVTQGCNPPDGTCASNPTLLRNVLSGGPPIPPAPPFQLPSTRTFLDSTAIDFRGYEKKLGTPYYSEWTFGISREFASNWAVEARYLGNSGVKLRRVADFNEINVEALDPATGQTFLDAFGKAQQNLACNNSSGFSGRFDDATSASCIVPNPLMAALMSGEPARLRNRPSLVTALQQNATGEFVYRLTQVETSAPSSGQSRIRGGSFWGAVLDSRFPANFFQANPFVASSRVFISDGTSNYHGMELELRRRFARGFSLQTNYTWGKALASFDGDSNDLLNDTRPSSVRYPEYTYQEFMPRHQFNANWIYELPFGTGKPFLAKHNLARKIFGGWQSGGLLSWRGGRPLSITSNIGTYYRSAISDENTVDLTQNVNAGRIREMTGERNSSNGVSWIDPCTSAFLGGSCSGGASIEGLFGLPQPGRLGQLGQSIIRGPRRFIVDLSLMKRTRLRETTDIEFRWEVFNAFNNTNFSTPGLDITSANFGQINRTVSEPRVMQFALKFNF